MIRRFYEWLVSFFGWTSGPAAVQVSREPRWVRKSRRALALSLRGGRAHGSFKTPGPRKRARAKQAVILRRQVEVFEGYAQPLEVSDLDF